MKKADKLPFIQVIKSRVVQQEALTRLLVEKGIFTKEKFPEMVSVVDREMRRKRDMSDSGRIT